MSSRTVNHIHELTAAFLGGVQAADEIVAHFRRPQMAHRTDKGKTTKTAGREKADEKQHKADAALLEKINEIAEDDAVVLEEKDERFLDGVCARVFGQSMTDGQRRYAEKLLEDIKP